MVEDGGPIWETIFSLQHRADASRPWLELRCDKDMWLFLAKFVDEIDNVPFLDENDHDFLFRGQSDSRWTLKPKLLRLWDKVCVRSTHEERVKQAALGQEYDSLHFFQKRVGCADTFYQSLDRKLSLHTYCEWLAAMQHYSAPTRLLDWSTSFYVALYFAVADDSVDGAVWILDAQAVRRREDKLIEKTGLTADTINDALACHKSYVEFGLRVAPLMEIVSNSYKTDRMIAQGSVFTISYQLFLDHAFVGLPLEEQALPLTKLVIPANAKRSIRRRLSKINVFADVLFPGLDGIGRTVYERMAVYVDRFEEEFE